MIRKSRLLFLGMAASMLPAIAATPRISSTMTHPVEPTVKFISIENDSVAAPHSASETTAAELQTVVDGKLAKFSSETLTDLQSADGAQRTQDCFTLLDLKATRASAPIRGLKASPLQASFTIPADGMRIITKDNTVNGTLSVSPVTMTKDSTGIWRLANVYKWGSQEGYTAPSIDIDVASGTVTIPAQQILLHSGYGSIWMVPITIQDGKYYYSLDPIKGKIDDKGTITLPSWGIMVPEGDKAGALFNVFTGSTWVKSNLTSNSQSAVNNEIVESWGYVEQVASNELAFYNISGYNYGDVLYATINSNKGIRMSPQKVFTNSLLGDFYAYSLTIGEKITVNTKSIINITSTTDSTLTMDPWGIVCKASSSYYANLFANTILTTDLRIVWPEAHQANFEGAGTQASPYLIKTADQLAIMSECVNENRGTYASAHYALTQDIDMANLSFAFMPIGEEASPFTGTFDGKGFTIKNLKLNGRGFAYTGLFGCTSDGEIKNLNLENATVTAGGMYVGGLVAYNNSLLNNVNVKGNIASTGEMVGGVAGHSRNYVTGASFKGQVQGPGDVGGIVGDSYASITKSHVEATLVLTGYSSLYHTVAGIAGSLMWTAAADKDARIEDCSASGYFNDAYGYGQVAGIVAMIANGAEVHRCFNTAALSAQRIAGSESDTSTGGIVAWAHGGAISDCYNAGSIVKTGTSDNTGGILGFISVSYVSGSGGTWMANQCYVTNCINTGQIVSTTSDGANIKGILGSAYGYGSFDPIGECISNCYSDSQISLTDGDAYGITTDELISGRLPKDFSSEIWETKVGFYPTIKGNNNSSAARLSAAVMHLTDGENVKKVKKNFTLTADDDVVWKLYFNSTFVDTSDALQIAGSNVNIKDIYSNAILVALDASSDYYKIYRVAVVPKVFQGEGTEASPYLITSVDDLKKLHTAVGPNAQPHEGDFFKMTTDLDFTNAKAEGFTAVGYGYVPSYYFGGSFDAAGHKISNLKYDAMVYDADGKAMNTSEYYTGFFNAIGPKGVVKNLIIDKSCEFLGYYCNGGVVGFSYGKVENCINHAPVTTLYRYGGGIAGYIDDGATIVKCYNDGDIKAGHSFVGGIVGGNAGDVTLCQNDGPISAIQLNSLTNEGVQGYAGGIAGGTAMQCVVDRCVNNGTITSYAAVGGISGNATQTTFKSCLSNGILEILKQNATIGAIIGEAKGVANTSEKCYFDASVIPNDASNSASLPGTTQMFTSTLTGGKLPEGLSSDDFVANANSYPVLKAFADQPSSKAMSGIFIGFGDKETASNVQKTTPLSPASDITWSLTEKPDSVASYFSISDGKLNVTVPSGMSVGNDVLTAQRGSYSKVFNLQTVPVLFTGKGSETDPYQLKTKEDLNKLADFIYTTNYDYANTHFSVMNDIDFAGDTLNIIAKGPTAVFNGVFHGNNHTIKGYVYENIVITNTAAKPHPMGYPGRYMGFFGKVGSLGRIENLTLDGSIRLYYYAGGLVGDLYGSVKGCKVKGTVSTSNTSSYTGGIASRVYAGGIIEDSDFEGTIDHSTGSYIGGVAYAVYEGATVRNCVNRGTINAKNCAGVVYQLTGEVRDCSTASIAKFGTFGITAGVVYTATNNALISGCKNYANLSSETLSTFAGIVSTTSTSTAKEGNVIVENCVNYGNITCKGYPAGIVARAYRGSTIRNCENYGVITTVQSSNIGGVIGVVEYGTADITSHVENCNNYGEVIGWQSYIGGITGKLGSYNTLTGCRNYGKVSSNVNTGSTHLAISGIAGSNNGEISKCLNAGEITAVGHGTGGIVGVLQSGTIDQCVNLANVSSTGAITVNMGCVGGIVGYNVTAGTVTNCYNMGDLSAPSNLSGLVARFNNAADYYIENCYNNGAVTWGSATSVPSLTSNLYVRVTGSTIHWSNLYYNSDVNTFTSTYDPANRGRSSQELMDIELGDAWTYNHATLPILTAFADDYQVLIAAVNVKFNRDKDHAGNVNGSLHVGMPAKDLVYTTSEHFEKNPSEANRFHPVKLGKGWIKVASPDGKYEKTIELVVNTASGVDSNLDNAEIVNVEYYDFTGVRLAQPVKGTLCIVRTYFSDGRFITEKKIVK